MAEQKYFPVYLEHEEAFDMLSPEETKKLLKALFTYAKRGERPSLTGLAEMALSLMLPRIEESFENYRKRCDNNRTNALKRWGENASACDGMQTHAMDANKRKGKKRNRERE